MGNAMSAKPGPKGDAGPRGPVGPPGPQGEPGIPDIDDTIDKLVTLDSRFIQPLSKRVSESSDLAKSVSDHLIENVQGFEDRVANKIQITPSIKQDLTGSLTNSLKSNPDLITGVSNSILNNSYTKNLLESKLTGNDSVFKTRIGDYLVTNYSEQLRGRPGDIADKTALKATLEPNTMWCADGELYCEIAKVPENNGYLTGQTRNLKEIVISNMDKNTRNSNFSRWKMTANNNNDFGKFNEYHIVPFLGKLDTTNTPTGYKTDKAIKIKYRGQPETTELHVPGEIVTEKLNIIPPGTILAYSMNTTPAGWLDCDGSAKSRTEYKDLFDVLGETWGRGDGATTFNLPDFRGRTLIGSGNGGTGFTNRTLAQTGGAETHTLTIQQIPAHNHVASTASAGSHNHNFKMGNSDDKNFTTNYGQRPPGDSGGAHNRGIYTDNAGAHTHTVTVNNTGGGQAHNNMQPFAVIKYIIKY
jgi:microcystin-dependent protein